MFETIFVPSGKPAWINIAIPGVGEVQHKFELPPDLKKALIDYAAAQGQIRIAEIQANMTVKSHSEAKENGNG